MMLYCFSSDRLSVFDVDPLFIGLCRCSTIFIACPEVFDGLILSEVWTNEIHELFDGVESFDTRSVLEDLDAVLDIGIQVRPFLFIKETVRSVDIRASIQDRHVDKSKLDDLKDFNPDF